MGQADYLSKGDRIDHTPGSALAVGDVVVLGDLVAVADQAIAANAKGSLAVNGLYNVAKTTSQAWTAGVIIYWDDTNNLATTSASGNKRMGIAPYAAGSADTTGEVLLGA